MSKSILQITIPPLDGRIAPNSGEPGRSDAFISSPCIQNHAANIMTLPGGDLGVVWFGGTQEGVADISIYFSRLGQGSDTWSQPVRLSNDPVRSEQNPILFPAPDGRLLLFWTAQRAGNQDTAIVRCRISENNGRDWGAIETLFGARKGGGTFVRQPVTVLENGDWLLPVFFCNTIPGEKWSGNNDTSAVMISSDHGRSWREYSVPDSIGAVHMCVVPLGEDKLVAFYRSRWADHIYASRSFDAGRTWTPPEQTELPNNNSSIQAVRLNDGSLAMVFNEKRVDADTELRQSLYDEIEDDEEIVEIQSNKKDDTADRRKAVWGTPRAPLTLAISHDGGKSWQKRRNLEIGDGYCLTNNSKDGLNREFSYPSINQTPDGMLHIAYTYFRRAIKYVRVPVGWVDAGPAKQILNPPLDL
jgi:predicted neuraminidase